MTAIRAAKESPLSGLRVLEFGQIAAGPFTGMLLADLGADVVKVERAGRGDDMRDWPPFIGGEENRFSASFAALNRNKRSLTADLKDPKHLAMVKRLCARADVVVENFRPGVMNRFQLGYEDLIEINKSIIYCSISGYGQSGPYARWGAFDVTVQAMSGVMSVTGEENRPPVKIGVPVGDFVAGLYAAFSIVAARSRGTSAYIDCSMLASLLGISALQTSEYFATGIIPRRLGSSHPKNAPYRAFEAEDRPFAVAAGNDALWKRFCTAIDMTGLLTDERFKSQELRARNQDDLALILEESFRRKPAHYWLGEFERQGVPCAPVNTFEDILSDPKIRELGLIVPLALPIGSTTQTISFPVRMSDFTFDVFRAPPKLGEHSEEVKAEWLR